MTRMESANGSANDARFRRLSTMCWFPPRLIHFWAASRRALASDKIEAYRIESADSEVHGEQLSAFIDTTFGRCDNLIDFSALLGLFVK